MSGSQNIQVLSILKTGKGITSLDAFKIGITRLAARIYDLRNDGYNIHSQIFKTNSGKKVSKYYLY